MIIRCLEAQTYPDNCFECIIVDDQSTDGRREYLEGRQSHLQLVKLMNTSNAGKGATKNVGWQHAKGEIVVFLDGDTLPDTDWLSDLARAFESQKYQVISGTRYSINVHPKDNDLSRRIVSLIGISAHDIFVGNVNWQFRMLHAYAELGTHRNPVSRQWELQLREICQSYPESLMSAFSFSGTNVAVRRELLKETGGFRSFPERGQDMDLGIRIWELGARFASIQGANTYHLSESTNVELGFTPIESTAFFHRHPYQEVFLVFLWFLQNLSPNDTSPKESLSELAGAFKKTGRISANWQQKLDQLICTDCRYSKEDLIRYYSELTAIPRELIAAYIDKAVERGLYVVRDGSGAKFDIPLTSRWLREQTPFCEFTLLNVSHVRNQDFLFQKGRLPTTAVSLSCRGVYEISIAPEALDGFELNEILNIPLPCEGAAQSALCFKSCWPPDLLDHADCKVGMIARYPWPRNQAEAIVSYEFSCEIHELGQHSSSENGNKQDLRQYLRPNLGSRNYVKARSILARLRGARSHRYDVAKNIYSWILDNTSFHNGLSREYDITQTGLGTCIDQSRLFVSLCRLAGIPSRERCGALLLRRIGSGDDGDVLEARSFYHSPCSHTWAEFYIEGRGWIPVEFVGWSFGSRGLTALNVVNLESRKKIVTNTGLYDDYYFGTIDPYRIHCSEHANRMPTRAACNNPHSLQVMQRLCEGIRHRLTCTVKFAHRRGFGIS